jgi:hypothetical protein
MIACDAVTTPDPLAQWRSATLDRLRARVPALRAAWQKAQPFHYLVADDFLPADFADAIHASYPRAEIEGWDKTTYIHQKKKLTMQSGFPAPVQLFFDLSASAELRALLSDISGVPKLIADPELVGGGLHQIMRGGFLDVHVDYNFHPRTKLHRRLNLLVYMNKDWQREYEGRLELWDLAANRQLEDVEPIFNRAVMFETNEISYHGHPRPLATPPEVTRRSLALYYYTAERAEIAPEHNTLYRQTTGAAGYLKTAISSAESVVERLRVQGPRTLAKELGRKLSRRLRGLPPENR